MRGTFALCVGVVVCALASGCPKKDPGEKPPPKDDEPPEQAVVDGRDLRRDPPQVASMEAMLLDKETAAGNALLLVKFAQSERLPPTLTITTEGKRVLLRDDGAGGDEKAKDGVFSTVFRIDLADLRARQGQIAQIRDKIVVPEFDGRVLKARPPLAPFDIDQIKPRLPFPWPPPLPAFQPADVDAGRSLVINDLGVVEDTTRTFNPCTNTGASQGKWTFNHLMTEMANQAQTGLDPAVFVKRWLDKWMADQVVNTFTVEQRIAMKTKVIDQWLAASGGAKLDLAKAPFRLLAIVNRVDLSDNLVYGQGSAGEGRFVFAVIDRTTPACDVMRFTVIFEYGIEAKGCLGLKAWAKQWFDLKQHAIGSPAYNAALEAITEQFVKAGAAPTKTNGSAINQIRTNEIALDSPWELREFRLDPLEGGHLREVTVKQEPDRSFHHDPFHSGPQVDTTTDFVNTHEAAVLLDEHVVTLDFPLGNPFLGGSAPTHGGQFWDDDNSPTITNRDARHHFSLNTCSGCHAGETNTGFVHIEPAPFGTPAGLSGFLTGIDVPDPADGGVPVRHFEDLLFRQQRTAEILNRSCLGILGLRKIKMIH